MKKSIEKSTFKIEKSTFKIEKSTFGKSAKKNKLLQYISEWIHKENKYIMESQKDFLFKKILGRTSNEKI